MIGVGDKVVCIAGDWHDEDGNKTNGPKVGEVFTVFIVRAYKGVVYLNFDGTGEDFYDKDDFRKLHDDTVENILKLMAERPVTIS